MIKSLLTGRKTKPIKSFDDTYETYVGMLHRVCFSYMKNQAEAEDVVADVFVKLLERGIVFESTEHEKAWLLRTSINLCKDRLKHWFRKRADIDDYSYLENPESSDGETLKAIMELPERYKAVIYLYYYEGYSSTEIAEILKKPRSTVLNHLSEARKALKGVLEDEKPKNCERVGRIEPQRRREKTYFEQHKRKTENA